MSFKNLGQIKAAKMIAIIIIDKVVANIPKSDVILK